MLWQPASMRLPAFELSALPWQFWLAGRYWPSLTANAVSPAKTVTAENTMTRCRIDGFSLLSGRHSTNPEVFPPPRAAALMVQEARFDDARPKTQSRIPAGRRNPDHAPR